MVALFSATGLKALVFLKLLVIFATLALQEVSPCAVTDVVGCMQQCTIGMVIFITQENHRGGTLLHLLENPSEAEPCQRGTSHPRGAENRGTFTCVADFRK